MDTPNSMYAPRGVKSTWMPCWYPVDSVSAYESWSPATNDVMRVTEPLRSAMAGAGERGYEISTGSPNPMINPTVEDAAFTRRFSRDAISR